jgi:uncharacterized protein
VSESAATGPMVPCPSCRQPSLFAPANRWRPFCSERCRSIDLGAWASESFRIPAEGPSDSGEAPPPKPDASH